MKLRKFIYIPVFVLCITACKGLIEFSPYDAGIVSGNINVGNISAISESVNENGDTLKFVLFSDSHISYDELNDAVKSINQQEGICFAVCCGDITDNGLAREFGWYHSIVKNLMVPLVTVIGNHDYRSNGMEIYTSMFGPTNMSFTFGSYTFIVFDDIVWENNNRSPKFDWLRKELAKEETPYSVLLAHIPPWTDQMEGLYNIVFSNIIAESNIILCLHGHEHEFSQRVYANVPAVVSGCIKKREYCIIKLYDKESKTERIRF